MSFFQKPMTTGKLPMPRVAWLAIISLSLIVNLPGLAITPMLDTLNRIFPDTSDLERQLLTMLPNLLIIPFVLMSGKLSTTPNKKLLIFLALLIYAGSTVGYFFSTSMLALIIFSCTLGIGAGLLVPFSTGLLADTFSGKYLMHQMGLQSAVSNLTLVCATFAVGWLALFDWHLPFLVYSVCLIPLALLPFLSKVPAQEMDPRLADKTPEVHQEVDPSMSCNGRGMCVPRLAGLFGLYFLMTLSTISVSEYTPYLVANRHMDASVTGTLTSIFFLFVFVSGFSLSYIVRFFRQLSVVVAAAAILAGMSLFTFVPSVFAMGAGIFLIGLGYGTMQPLIYNKATLTVCRPSLATQALAIALTSNYLAIVVEPLMTQGICELFNKPVDGTFPFIISECLTVLLFVLAVIFRKSFVFRVDKSQYQ